MGMWICPINVKFDSYLKYRKIFMSDKYICTICATIYDPERGDPETGVLPGTRFEDLPEDWVCTICGSSKDNFVVLPPEKHRENIPKI